MFQLHTASGRHPTPGDAGGPLPHPRRRRLQQHRLREELQRLPAHGGLRLGRRHHQQVGRKGNML